MIVLTSVVNKPGVITTPLSEMALWKRFLAKGDNTCHGEKRRVYTQRRGRLTHLPSECSPALVTLEDSGTR